VVSVRADAAVDQLRASYLTTINGVPSHEFVDDPAAGVNTDFYPTRDGRWIFFMMPYPHLRDVVCRLLNCAPSKDRIAEASQDWDAVALEEPVCEAGGVAAVICTTEEWRGLPVGQASLAHPVVRLDRIGEAPPSLPCPNLWPPLNGLRVLDLTHVIAGPIASRLLAAFGADVLHVSRPDLADPNALLALTGGGKCNAFCDLRAPGQAAQMLATLEDADVFVNSYRGMPRRGFGAEALAGRVPGLVTLEYHCWGSDGPWSERGGFDQLACSATGFAIEEGIDGKPALPPTNLLNDYLAAYLGAAGVLAALRRRATEGGSWRVRIELARVCSWVQDLGGFSSDEIRSLPRPGEAALAMHSVEGPLGTVIEPVIPVEFEGFQTPKIGPAHLLGTSPLAWL